MLMCACDVRLPVHLSREDYDAVAEILLDAVEQTTQPSRAYGT